MGRKKIEIDLNLVEKLAVLQPSHRELAHALNVSEDTIERRLKDDPDFAGAYKKGRDEGLIGLRRAQFKAALGGNITMLIWLGKQLLGQTDKQETAFRGSEGVEVSIKIDKANKTNGANGEDTSDL